MLLHCKYRLRWVMVGALALGAAVNANAWIITMSGTNNVMVLAGTYESSNLIGNAFTYNVSGGVTGGSFGFMNGGQSLLVNYTGTSIVAGNTISFDGTWSEVSQTGLNNVDPHGTYSGSFDNQFTHGDWEWSFVGTTTPEPAPLVVMGLGFVGLIARRRRKN